MHKQIIKAGRAIIVVVVSSAVAAASTVSCSNYSHRILSVENAAASGASAIVATFGRLVGGEPGERR